MHVCLSALLECSHLSADKSCTHAAPEQSETCPVRNRWLGGSEAQPSKPQTLASQRQAQEPQPRKSPWYKGQDQGTKLSASRVLSEREMELIELGGAG